MAFLLDSSESAKNFNHEQQKKFVLETVDRMKGLQLSSGRPLSWRTALLQYSSTVLIEQTFRDWKGPEAFKSRIAPITYIGHGTYTTYAITNLTQLYMTEGTHGSVKVAVLLTDGADHPRNPDIFSATADAKHQGIVFFTVGMTRVAEEVANAAKLRLLASVPASRFVFNLQEKDVVERILKEMVGANTSVGQYNGYTVYALGRYNFSVDYVQMFCDGISLVTQGSKCPCFQEAQNYIPPHKVAVKYVQCHIRV